MSIHKVRLASLIVGLVAVSLLGAAPAGNLANPLNNGQIDPADAQRIEEIMRLRALQMRGRSGGPKTGMPIIINGGQPLPPAVATPSGIPSDKATGHKTSKQRREEARQRKEELKRQAREAADKKKSDKKADKKPAKPGAANPAPAAADS